MVLDGKMHLVHAGHHEVELKPFEQDRFLGDWQTQCLGSGQDFNLMLGNGWQGAWNRLFCKAGRATIQKLLPTTACFVCRGFLKSA